MWTELRMLPWKMLYKRLPLLFIEHLLCVWHHPGPWSRVNKMYFAKPCPGRASTPPGDPDSEQ